MIGFRTKSGSIYYIDQKNKKIWGAAINKKYGGPVKYVRASFIIGERGYVEFEDGMYMSTNIIESYF